MKLLTFWFALASAILVFSLASADTVEHTFTVQNKAITRLCNERVIVTVNGLYPGPTLEVREGDAVIIHVVVGDWYDGNVVDIYEHVLAAGDVRVSDAFTINGLPGDLFNCSKQPVTTVRQHDNAWPCRLRRLHGIIKRFKTHHATASTLQRHGNRQRILHQHHRLGGGPSLGPGAT
ncbi:Laccase-7 protein [Vigna angularis]|uniref:Laccase-7 protein n=1 Tax=Phaseolus angularis TaxID=3914 RepID=A0A8T0KWQ3_PHAAN|nr:Laccase-7 protein [Vigna angularis]